MANIKTHLDKIKNALFGQEVRGSIHDGIDAINKEVEGTTEKQNKLGEQFKNLVINEGNSNAEVAASRGSHDWLPDRLDNFDSQLEHKANINEVVKKGYGTLSDFDEETRRAIQGIDPTDINAVLGYSNVTPYNTNFVEVDSENIININDISDVGFWCNTDNGEIINNEFTQSYRNTGYIEGTTNTKYFAVNRISSICFFSDEKSFLSSINDCSVNNTINGVEGHLFEFPSNAKYMIVNIYSYQYENSILLDLYGGDNIDIPKFKVVKTVNGIKPDEYGNVVLDLNEAQKKYEGNLKDKVIVHFGDSICQGATYPQIISNRTGAITYNCGIGGTQMKYSDSEYGLLSFSALVKAITKNDFSEQESVQDELYVKDKIDLIKSIDFKNVDILTIAYGTNDFGGNVTIGENLNEDVSTFKGAMLVAYKQLMEFNPKLKIYFLTPIYRDSVQPSNGNSDDNDNGYGNYLMDYVNAYIEMQDIIHCPVLNQYKNSGINRYNADTYLSDRLHPNQLGNDLIAEKVCNFILSN